MKTRMRRRRSTRSADHDAMVCTTASAMKPSASRLTAVIGDPPCPARCDPHATDEAERGHRRPGQAMPPAQQEGIVEQRAGEQPEHHDGAGRQRDQRRMPRPRPAARPDDQSPRARPSRREGGGDRPATPSETAKQRRRQHQQQRHGAGPQRDIEGGKQHRSRSVGSIRRTRFSADRLSVQFSGQAVHGALRHPDDHDIPEQIELALLDRTEPPRHGLEQLGIDSMDDLSTAKVRTTQPTEARAASTAYPLPRHSLAIPQPTSKPGHPGGQYGPTRPTYRPDDFSSTTNMPTPCSTQCPAMMAALRQPLSSRVTGCCRP